MAWYERNSEYRPHQVGEKPANPWGLYDMLGNMWEWTANQAATYSKASVKIDPRTLVEEAAYVSGNGHARMRRGGSVLDGADSTRSAARSELPPGSSIGSTGFRVLLTAAPVFES